MTIHNSATRRRVRRFARVGAIGAAIMTAVTGWSWLSAAAAPTNAGNAQVTNPDTGQPLTSGGSATKFTLKLPQGAACTGDSANDGYRVQSYMVKSSVDPGTLTYGSHGPQPTATGANFSEPLFGTDANQTPYVNQQTAAASPHPGPGPIINIPSFNFAWASPGDIPAGTYNVGIACTLPPPNAGQVDKWWGTQMTFTTSQSDSPAQVTWTAQASSTTPTTSGSGGTTTSTTAGSGGTTTSTTAHGTTTTTTGSGSTTTTTASGGTTTTTTASGPTATVTDANGNQVAANSTLAGGQQVTVTATGFAATETVTIAVHSATVTLGTAVADANGKVTASVVIPTSLDAGAHTLTVTGAATTASFPFMFAGSSGSSSSSGGSSGASSSSSGGSRLPFTGSDPLVVLVWAGLLIAFGRIAVLLGRPVTERGTSERHS